MNNQINIKNLTPEQIEDLKNQLKAYDEQPKSIMDKVKSWEDAMDITMSKDVYFIDAHSKIVLISGLKSVGQNKNVVPSEKHAKSILATTQLMVIAEALNKGWKPDYKSSEYKYHVEFDYENGLGIDYWNASYVTPIVFKSGEIAEYAITQFEDLWYDYFMIDKPKFK